MSIYRFNAIFGSCFAPFLSPDGAGGGGYADNDDNDDDDGVTDDDFSAALNAAMLDDDEDDDEDDEADDSADEEGSEKEPEEGERTAQEEPRTFTQEDIDRIIGERLARDRSAREAQQQEQTQQQAALLAQQMLQQQQAQQQQQSQRQIYEQELSKRAEAKVNTYGFDEDTARQEAAREIQAELRLAMMERQVQAQQQAAEANRVVTQYMSDRGEALAKTPLVAQYIDEIDSVSRGGTAIDFATAMNYVLGTHVASGDLVRSLQEAAEQKTLKNVSARKKIGAEKGGAGGGSGTSGSLTKEQRLIARAFGVPEKAYAKNLTKKK